MTMKKTLGVIVAASIGFALIGCSKSEDAATTDPKAAPDAPTASPKQNTAAAGPAPMLGPGAVGADQRAGSKAGN